MSGGYFESVKRVSGRYLKYIWNVSVMCLERGGKVSDSYWKVSGKGLLRGCCVGVEWVFRGCSRGVTRVSQRSHNSVSWEL